MRVLLIKHFNSLRPVDQAGEEAFSRYGHGDVVSVEIKKPRNLAFHRLYWALLTIVHDNLDGDRYPTVEDLHAAIKIAVGLRTQIELPDGTIGFIPGSIAFHKMDDLEFGKFFNRVCDLVAKHFLSGVNDADLRMEVQQITGIPVDRDMQREPVARKTHGGNVLKKDRQARRS